MLLPLEPTIENNQSTQNVQTHLHAMEHQMTSWDGSALFYRSWHIDPSAPVQPQRALILFHGGHEHSGRFQDLVERLQLEDTAIFAWDARGHGRSPGERGYANHFQDLVRDADSFIHHIAERFQIPTHEMVLLAHSVGSLIASTWVHDYAEPIKGMVLGSPAFNVKLYVPFALPGLKLWQSIQPNGFVNSYVKPGMLTHDQQEAEVRRNDPLISPKIAVRVLASLFDTSERVIQGAQSIRVPTLLFSADSDWVVRRSAQRRFFDALGSQQKIFQTLPGFYHEVFHEKGREQPIAQAREFILQCFATREHNQTPVVRANEAQFNALNQPLKWGDWKRVKFQVTKTALRTVGCLSHGIRLGWQQGFDSGPMLDYVYANQATGWGPLGRWMDRVYLNSPGWKGIRQRREHLKQLLSRTIQQQLKQEANVHVVDLAAGPGRYLLEVMQSYRSAPITALCRDWDEKGLSVGRRLAMQMGIESVQYKRGDAFSPESLGALQPRPNIVIVSGLYELFDDNDLILQSLQGIRQQLAPGGVLIYTNQPHHPQLEMIARTLHNRDGKPWVMRPRSAAEMDTLVTRAGFAKQQTLMDDEGIFSVSLAAQE